MTAAPQARRLDPSNEGVRPAPAGRSGGQRQTQGFEVIGRLPLAPAVRALSGLSRNPRLRAQSVLRLQQGYGNQAVSRAFQNGSEPEPVEEQTAASEQIHRKCACGGSGDDDGPCESCASGGARAQRRAESSSARVPDLQRDVLDVAAAVLPSGLVDKVRGVVDLIRGAGPGVTNDANATGETAQGHAQQASEEAQSGGRQAVESGEGEANTAAQQGQQESTAVQSEAAAQSTTAGAAGGALGGAGSAVAPYINPALPVMGGPGVQGVIQKGLDIFRSIPGGVADLGSNIGNAVQSGLGEGGTPGWDCDKSEIAAIAGGAGRAVADAAVKAGQKVFGKDRFNAAMAFVQQKIAQIQQTIATVRTAIANAATAIRKWWDDHVGKWISRIEEVGRKISAFIDAIKQRVKKAVDGLLKSAVDLWNQAKTWITTQVQQKIDSAKKFVDEKVAWVRNFVGSWWSSLPDFIKAPIEGAGAVLAAPIAAALAVVKRIVDFIESHKDGILTTLRYMVDSAVQRFASVFNSVREAISSVTAKVKKWASDIGKKISDGAQSAYKWLDDLSGGRISKLRDAASAVGAKIKGAACAALGTTAGPCVEQFVPDPGPGGSTSVKLSTSAEVTAPVEGVPVKAGRGASITITRKGKTYSVAIAGSAQVGVTASGGGGGGGGGGGDSLTASVDLPFGGKADHAWKRLTGGAPAAAPAGQAPAAPVPAAAPATAPAAHAPAPAPGAAKPAPASAAPGAQPPAAAGQPGQAPAGGGSGSVSAEGGIKGSLEMTYEFDASKDRSSCDGLGGLTALLAAEGVSAALPPPFDSIAGAVTQSGFAKNLTSCKFTLAEYGQASFELKSPDGVSSLKATISGETGVTMATQKNEKGEMEQTATVSQTLSGSVAAQLSAEYLGALAASGSLSGTLSLVLKYFPDRGVIRPSQASAQASGTFALQGWPLLRQLPGNVFGTIEQRLKPVLPLATSGSITLEAQYTIKNLDQLLALLAGELSNEDTVTASRLLEVVRNFVGSPDNRSGSFTVTLTRTEKILGASVSGGTGQGAEKVEGSVSAGVERSSTMQLYP